MEENLETLATYEPVGWENAEITKEATVTIDGIEYEVTPRIVSGKTPVNATNLSHMDDAIQENREAINDLYNGGATTSEIVISETEPTNEDWKIWIDTNEVNNLGIVDCVIEQGTNYRKWESGKIEIFGKEDYSNFAISSAWGTGFYGVAELNYPITLKEVKTINCTPMNNKDLMNISLYNVDANLAGIFVQSYKSITTSFSVYYYIIGTWK